jgi:hypothetical protein
MKFTKEHYESLKEAIKKALDRDGMFMSQWKLKYQDQSETRMLWDLYWLSGWSNDNRQIVDIYLDSHIQSALRQCAKEL